MSCLIYSANMSDPSTPSNYSTHSSFLPAGSGSGNNEAAAGVMDMYSFAEFEQLNALGATIEEAFGRAAPEDEEDPFTAMAAKADASVAHHQFLPATMEPATNSTTQQQSYATYSPAPATQYSPSLPLVNTPATNTPSPAPQPAMVAYNSSQAVVPLAPAPSTSTQYPQAVYTPETGAPQSTICWDQLRRSGKWTHEEEVYADLLIENFEKGYMMDERNGCTLRSFLARKLHCAPMRISKKFAGKGIGKMAYVAKINQGNTKDGIGSEVHQKSIRKLKKAEENFYESCRALSMQLPQHLIEAARQSQLASMKPKTLKLLQSTTSTTGQSMIVPKGLAPAPSLQTIQQQPSPAPQVQLKHLVQAPSVNPTSAPAPMGATAQTSIYSNLYQPQSNAPAPAQPRSLGQAPSSNDAVPEDWEDYEPLNSIPRQRSAPSLLYSNEAPIPAYVGVPTNSTFGPSQNLYMSGGGANSGVNQLDSFALPPAGSSDFTHSLENLGGDSYHAFAQFTAVQASSHAAYMNPKSAEGVQNMIDDVSSKKRSSPVAMEDGSERSHTRDTDSPSCSSDGNSRKKTRVAI
eukprot:Nitzschia sp. Nitz4//scaffold14_size191712//116790//118680//NITZ4_001734-RA/size191712-augustus-gene-0.248-mRNA-1//-1//CDS//3329536960//4524//frame0